MNKPLAPEDRLIIALDAPSVERAEAIVESLGVSGRFYKIGYQLMPIGGLDLARRLYDAGKRIFLDFKFHDIGATVARGAASVARAGADILTVHAEPDVVSGAVEGRADNPRLKIFAVTVLTSVDQHGLARMGVTTPLAELVLRRAEIAAEAGADGVIASAREAAAIKARFGERLLIATPGVRPEGARAHDQKRVVTPTDAIRAGADYLVVGRPIVEADDPAAAAAAILSEMARAAIVSG